ncbi:hypothetical protein Q5H92_02240 [Hymenobacter sp. M29]|uniref:DUF2946 domain-containing protein n=1 Tax=Hymenobacter mellowenesis TaxID=3063995 RepID=A0ABT9A5P8_9BACT|nr:hypothetical protein [Hymenobacter sp. M29]MDO7845160.1 hypothetical protein [Hymenobacter sp. M29]
MFRLLPATIRLTASALLVVFLSALLGPAVALAELLPHRAVGEHLHLPNMPQAHHHHDDDHDQNRDDDHYQDHHAPVAQHSSSPHHGHHACTGDDDQSLTGLAPLLKLLGDYPAPAVLALPPVQDFAFRPFQAWDRQQAVALVPPEHLKPKIPDLRIFIGSLVI